MKALTVRPAFAWAIFNAGKDVENRSWPTNYRGPLVIHASASIASADDDADTIEEVNPAAKVPIELECGAVIGIVDVVDCRRDSSSPWAESDSWHWVLANPRPCEPVDVKGKLGFWEIADDKVKLLEVAL